MDAQFNVKARCNVKVTRRTTLQLGPTDLLLVHRVCECVRPTHMADALVRKPRTRTRQCHSGSSGGRLEHGKLVWDAQPRAALHIRLCTQRISSRVLCIRRHHHHIKAHGTGIRVDDVFCQVARRVLKGAQLAGVLSGRDAEARLCFLVPFASEVASSARLDPQIPGLDFHALPGSASWQAPPPASKGRRPFREHFKP